MIFDVAIVGAGLVGASLARALAGSGMRCALISAAPPPAQALDGWDSRVYTLTPATQSFLEEIGVWPLLDPGRLAPVLAMQVFGDDGESQLEFSAYETGAERLACVVESALVQRALWKSFADQQDLELFCPATLSAIDWRADYVVLKLEHGANIAARLVVGADGTHSRVRTAAGIATRLEPLGEQGVVANFVCSTPHRGVAYQWFRSDGVLAWLPLPGERFSMVWSTSDENSRALLEAGPQSLCERVASAGCQALGALQLLTPAVAFALNRLTVTHRVRPRLALIGDAAHVIHPLAGQGVNLGFADARSLARVLRSRENPADSGDWSLLRRFERERAEDIVAMRFATEGLHRLFAARSPVLSRLRNLGLNLTDRLPVVKTLLARQAMGHAGRI
jgi:2-polyprenylphenol 6-hydroxylase